MSNSRSQDFQQQENGFNLFKDKTDINRLEPKHLKQGGKKTKEEGTNTYQWKLIKHYYLDCANKLKKFKKLPFYIDIV